jgi:hypothetical protein
VKNCLLALLVTFSTLLACVHGKYVGANYVPAKMYPGEELPDARLATVVFGVIDDGLFAQVKVMDGVEHPIGSFVIQVLPGRHALEAKILTVPQATGARSVRWKESKETFKLEAEFDPGVVYALMPEPEGDSVVPRIRKLCPSTEHVETARAYRLRHERVCK